MNMNVVFPDRKKKKITFSEDDMSGENMIL